MHRTELKARKRRRLGLVLKQPMGPRDSQEPAKAGLCARHPTVAGPLKRLPSAPQVASANWLCRTASCAQRSGSISTDAGWWAEPWAPAWRPHWFWRPSTEPVPGSQTDRSRSTPDPHQLGQPISGQCLPSVAGDPQDLPPGSRPRAAAAIMQWRRAFLHALAEDFCEAVTRSGL